MNEKTTNSRKTGAGNDSSESATAAPRSQTGGRLPSSHVDTSAAEEGSIQEIQNSIEPSKRKSKDTPETSIRLPADRQDAIKFMKDQAGIPISQRKQLVAIIEKSLKRQIAIKSDEEFYDCFLDYIEERPSRVVFLAVKSVFNNIDTKNLTAEKMSKAVVKFAPIKLAIKIVGHEDKILEELSKGRHDSLPKSDLVGLVFSLGLVYGFPYFEAVKIFLEKKEVNEKTKRAVQLAEKRITSLLGKRKFREIIPLCENAVTLDDKLSAEVKEIEAEIKNLQKLENNFSEKPIEEINLRPIAAEEYEEQLTESEHIETKDNEEDSCGNDSEESEEVKVNQRKELELVAKIPNILGDLIRDGYIAVAARFADACERHNRTPTVPAASLNLAAASRISVETLSTSVQKFGSGIEPAVQDVGDNPHGNAVIAGATLCISILQPELARTAIGRLNLGIYASTIGSLVREISNTEFSFRPTLDDLASAAGESVQPDRSDIEEELSEWKRIIAQGKYANHFRKLDEPNGELGQAINLILNGQIEEASDRVPSIIERYRTAELIEARVEKVRDSVGGKQKRTFPTNELREHLESVISLLRRWIRFGDPKSLEKDRDMLTVEVLTSHANNSIELLDKKKSSKDITEAAISIWLAERVKDLLLVLKGQLPELHKSMNSSLYSEFDFLPLPNEFPEKEEAIHENDRELINFLSTSSVPTREDAIRSHTKAGAFRKAARLLDGMEDQDKKDELIDLILVRHNKSIVQISERATRCFSNLRDVRKYDVKRHNSIQHEVEELDRIQKNLNEISDVDSLKDPSWNVSKRDIHQIARHLSRLEKLVDDSRSSIRVEQKQRLLDLRPGNPDRVKEIDELIDEIKNKRNLGSVEQGISNIAYGRPVGQATEGAAGPLDEFFPKFVRMGEASDWPTNYDQYSGALEAGGVLAIPNDRRKAGRLIFRNWFGIVKGVESGNDNSGSVENFMRELSFRDVKLNGGAKRIQDYRAITYDITMSVPDNTTRTWFLPPIFGSRSNKNYAIMVVHPDVLIEQVLPNVKMGVPTFLIITGWLGVERRKELAKRLRDRNATVLLCDEALVAFIASRKEDRLSVLFDCGLPFGRIEPYHTAAGDLPPEMFFGREQEISKIVRPSADGVLVYGGRQLGKTALLTQVQALYHKSRSDFIVTFEIIRNLGKSIKTKEIWGIIAQSLKKGRVADFNSNSYEDIASGIKSWLSDHPHGRILCLFDEADKFLAYEAKNDFPNLGPIKTLMEDTNRRFKAVFVGLHNAQRMFKSSNSPLAHFGEICVGPLTQSTDDLEAARRLVEVPMRAAGYRFDRTDALDDILSYVNYYPSLAQVYCEELVGQLNSGKIDDNGPLWKIPYDMLFQGHGFEMIQEKIHGKFQLTLELDTRYKLIAYTLGLLMWTGREADVLHGGLPAQEIQLELKEYWPEKFEPIKLTDLHNILDEMFELGVIGKISNEDSPATYRLATSQVANMLGSKGNIEKELLKLYGREPEVEYDPSTFRPILGGTDMSGEKDARNVSPLTVNQLNKIVADDENKFRCCFVIGTELLGVNYVGKAIKEFVQKRNENTDEEDIDVRIVQSRDDFVKEMRDSLKDSSELKIVIFDSIFDIEHDLVDFAEKQSLVTDGRVRAVLVIDPTNANLSADIICSSLTLRPWGNDMLRNYLEQVEQEDEEDYCDLIMNKTGGVPDSIVRILKDVVTGDGSRLTQVKDSQGTIVKGIYKDEKIVRATFWLYQYRSMIKSDAEKGDAYDCANQEIRKEIGVDLVTIGYDLLALGILDAFEPQEKTFSITPLGNMLARQEEQRESSD